MKSYSLSDNCQPKPVLLAPNAFKGTLGAEEFCRILAEEFQPAGLYTLSFPMCDGGDGTAAILASYLGAVPVLYPAPDALGRPHTITYYIKRDTAILDLAGICGLKDLAPSEYDVYNANTRGLGKVLLHLSRQNIRHILLGVGGSASIDGGLGALTEMGLKIIKNGEKYKNDLLEIKDFNLSGLKDNFKDIEWTILCDVENPFCGPTGAATIFGPQKGATPLQVTQLDKKLNDYAGLLLSVTGKNMLQLKHGGAAGGIAGAFHALFNARLVSGATYCLRLSGFMKQLTTAKVVITGEGKLDSQSLKGKLPGVICSLCKQYHIPVIGVAGSVNPPIPAFDQVYTLLDYAVNLSDAMHQPCNYLRRLAKDLKRNILKL